MAQNKTGGGVGTNQYQIRGHARTEPAAVISETDLLGQLQPSESSDIGAVGVGRIADRRKCGEVWGTNCDSWVESPSWYHGQHVPHIDQITDMLADLHADPATLRWYRVRILDGDTHHSVKAIPGLLCVIAENPACPASLLHQLAADGYSTVRHSVAGNPSAPPSLIEEIYNSEPRRADLLRDIADNPSCPASLLEQLAHPQEACYIIDAISANPAASAVLLDRLYDYDGPWSRKRVAGNTSIGADTAARAAAAPEFATRWALAGNPQCPTSALLILLRDSDRQIRDQVLRNPSLPAYIRNIYSVTKD